MRKKLTMHKLPILLPLLLLIFYISTISDNFLTISVATNNTLTDPPSNSDSVLKKIGKDVLVAHRGIISSKPENSLPAFKISKEMGFNVVETDLRLTKDHQWVLMHDYTIDRTTTGNGPVDKYSLKDLNKFKIKDGNQDLSIPTLNDFLSLCEANSIYPILDMKVDNTQINRKAYYDLINSLETYNLLDKTIISSPSKVLLTNIRKLNDIITLAAMVDVTKENINYVKSFNNMFIYYDYRSFNPDKFRLLRENNIDFGVWTVNDEKAAQFFFKQGASMVVTDTIFNYP